MRTAPYVRKLKSAPRIDPVEIPDFPAIAWEMVKAGYPKMQIALQADITREKLYSLLKGRYEPTYREGSMLLKLNQVIKEKQCAT